MTKGTLTVYKSLRAAINEDKFAFNFEREKIPTMLQEFNNKMTRNFTRGSPHWGVHKELCKSEKISIPGVKKNQ